ncbi:hypothetical protein TNCV_4199991 [Trichonephila clavipes]|uniref:Uncharacterized protein n=1 Tax=Trichonephila clavipes TaxID=2585209 RepID=A0A8X6WB04_TRICX|nr:hypothetical protein TNCV_4199991 [Trichonephila clavipes]
MAKELGEIEADKTLPKIEIINRMRQSDGYEEETVKYLLEGNRNVKKLNEWNVKRREWHEREIRERRPIREFELERMRIQMKNKVKGSDGKNLRIPQLLRN